jgi:hypothetical protein
VITIEPELRAIARVGLPGAPPPPPVRWDEWLDPVMASGLAGLFSSGAAAGLIDIDAAMAARLQRQLELEATRAVQLEGELLRLGPALERLGAVVMWGPVLAHGAYRDPLFRPFSHLDMLVAGRRMPEAVSVFAHYGYQLAQPPIGSGLDARVGKAFALEHPGGVMIRLHRTLAAGSIGEDAGWRAAGHREVMIGSHPVAAPSWEVHLLECTLDAIVEGGLTRPLAVRDIAEMLHHPMLDPVAAVDLAERWQIARPVGYSLRAARDALGLDLPPALAALARRSAAPPPAMAVAATAPYQGTARPPMDAAAYAAAPVDWRHNGDTGQHAPPVRSLPALPEAVGTHTGELGAPAGPPELQAANPAVTGELATVNLGERSSPPPVRAAHRNGILHPGAGVAAGRQGAWTSARPPRQGTTRARSRSGATGTSRNGAGDRAGDDSDGPGPPAEPPASGATPGARTAGAPPTRLGLVLGLTGGALLVATAACTQLGNHSVGIVLVPVAGLLLAAAAGHRIARRHPGEDWVGRWLMLAVAVKLTASYFRYQTLINRYEGVGDAVDYHNFGQRLASAWLEGGAAPELGDMRQHNFVRWFTGVVYYLFGIDMITGFLVFGLLALVGSYLWYRAAAEAVPGINRRLYLGLVMFLPSMAYWPASIGKESLMQLAIGMIALATAQLLRQRLVTAFVLGAPGGVLLWYVRPHLLAMAMVAVGCAYIGGRVRGSDSGLRAFLTRPVGLLAVALLVGFTVSQGAEFLGLEELSIGSVEARLEQEAETSEGLEGGSSFDTGGSSLNPLYLPQGAVTVLLRPFPWETDSSLQLLASLESALVAALIISRLPSLGAALARARSTPFLLYCWGLVILYAATFSSIGNFGILVRQRSLVLPALFVLIAVRPTAAATAADASARTTTRSATSRGVHAGSH